MKLTPEEMDEETRRYVRPRNLVDFIGWSEAWEQSGVVETVYWTLTKQIRVCIRAQDDERIILPLHKVRASTLSSKRLYYMGYDKTGSPLSCFDECCRPTFHLPGTENYESISDN